MHTSMRKPEFLLLLALLFVAPAFGEEEVLYRRDELNIVFHQLNYIDAGDCIEILEMIGYDAGPPVFPVSKDNLPLVLGLPESANISIVGAGVLDQVGDGAPQQRIGIIYHEDQVQEYGDLVRLIDDKIDIQATQVQIEAMVVELNESGMRELGMEYDLMKDMDLDAPRRGRGAAFDAEGMLGLSFMRFTEDRGRFFEARLQALIEDRMAEVLFAPSVLTLDNRHAKIEILREIPVFEGRIGIQRDDFDIDVRYEQAGIILNIKPRVDRTGEWVTLQVQTEVSEKIGDLRFRGEPVAPEIERRIIETISRIRNNHPFIVGGLIRDEKDTFVRKVPLLGDVPLLGRLFRTEKTSHEKREVIIVLTPRVIRPTASDRPIMPKDDERFDFFDTRLFRESYTLKSEDIYDLAFILDRPEMKRILAEAQRHVDRNPGLAERPPFDAIAEGGIPGEEAVVNRMLYGVVRKTGLFREVDPNRLIYFTPDDDDPAGFSVASLSGKLREVAGDRSVEEYLKQDFPKRVLYVLFDMPDPESIEDMEYPVATTMIEYQRSAAAAEERLHELCRLDGKRRERIGFMIHNRREIERLQSSIVVREVLEVNDPDVIQRLANFQVGRRIAIPVIDPARERTFLIDREAADPFFFSHFYYAEFESKLQTYIRAIREVLDAQGTPD